MILTVLGNFGDSSSGLGALGIDGTAFLIQLITFILAYLVLRKWAFGPIMKVLRQRRETIASGVALGEQMQKERTQLDEKVKSEIKDARDKADSIITEAEEAAKESVKQAEVEAQTKAETIIKEAEVRTKQEMDRAKRAMEYEIAGLVAEATEVLTGEKVDAKKDAGLINKALAGKVES